MAKLGSPFTDLPPSSNDLDKRLPSHVTEPSRRQPRSSTTHHGKSGGGGGDGDGMDHESDDREMG